MFQTYSNWNWFVGGGDPAGTFVKLGICNPNYTFTATNVLQISQARLFSMQPFTTHKLSFQSFTSYIVLKSIKM